MKSQPTILLHNITPSKFKESLIKGMTKTKNPPH